MSFERSEMKSKANARKTRVGLYAEDTFSSAPRLGFTRGLFHCGHLSRIAKVHCRAEGAASSFHQEGPFRRDHGTNKKH
jgi:hypothetical protein